MSPPSKDNQENRQEKGDEEPKFGVEEQGGKCQDPALHQELNERACKALLFMQAGLGEFVQRIYFTLYFMFGTGLEIDEQITMIRKFVKDKVPHLTPLAFLGTPDGNDNYIFTVPLCGKGCIKFIAKVAKSCSVCFDPEKILVLIDDIKKKSQDCLDGAHAYEMRLHNVDLPASISFSLLCKKTLKFMMRTPTTFKVVILATDEGGNEITTGNHSVEKQFPACFYNTDVVPQNDDDGKNNRIAGNSSLLSSNDKRILEENHAEICQKIQNWPSFIGWFITNGRLDKKFLKFPYTSLTEERKGEILRHLYEAENIFSNFIEALKSSSGNEELVEFLLQCMASMENQNSSLE